VRQLVRRLRTCEAGSALVEYGLLIAVVALCLMAVLQVFRNTVGGLTNRAAVDVSTKTKGGYGAGGGGRVGGGGHAAHKPATPEADSASAEPGGSSETGGAAAVFRLDIP
jgi:Flp pilus assembly pilin Flp